MKKYKQYSKITGYFNITPKNNEEMDILASFDTNVYNNKKAKIKSKDVEKLFTKKLKNFDFLQLLSVVTKEELITNKQVREILVNNEVEFFSTLIKFCENGIGKEWIIAALQKKLYGYPSIKKLYKKALDERNNYLLEIKERKNELIRPPVANIDQAFIVMSISKPDFSDNLLRPVLPTRH